MAGRLSEVGDWKVLLLEAGGEQPSKARVPWLHILLFNSPIDWRYVTEPNPNGALAGFTQQVREKSTTGSCKRLFSLLAFFETKNWPSRMKMMKVENFQKEVGLKRRKWSNLNDPGTQTHCLIQFWKWTFSLSHYWPSGVIKNEEMSSWNLQRPCFKCIILGVPRKSMFT